MRHGFVVDRNTHNPYKSPAVHFDMIRNFVKAPETL